VRPFVRLHVGLKKILWHVKGVMTALVRSLVACGALAKKKTGPANPRPPEEAAQVRREQCALAFLRRKAMLMEAKEQGLPQPVFMRGRPKKYATTEEAMEARRMQCKLGTIVYQERVKQGINALRDINLSTSQLARSSA